MEKTTPESRQDRRAQPFNTSVNPEIGNRLIVRQLTEGVMD